MQKISIEEGIINEHQVCFYLSSIIVNATWKVNTIFFTLGCSDLDSFKSSKKMTLGRAWAGSGIRKVVKSRVADPHSFHPDPDPAF
jgi:hypothetical protein